MPVSVVERLSALVLVSVVEQASARGRNTRRRRRSRSSRSHSPRCNHSIVPLACQGTRQVGPVSVVRASALLALVEQASATVALMSTQKHDRNHNPSRNSDLIQLRHGTTSVPFRNKGTQLLRMSSCSHRCLRLDTVPVHCSGWPMIRVGGNKLLLHCSRDRRQNTPACHFPHYSSSSRFPTNATSDTRSPRSPVGTRSCVCPIRHPLQYNSPTPAA